MNAPTRVLQSPELLHAVYQLSDCQDQFTLLHATRSFFRVGASIIWERVEGVHHLLVLFPNVQCTTHEGDPRAKTIVSSSKSHLYSNCHDLTCMYPRLYHQTPYTLDASMCTRRS